VSALSISARLPPGLVPLLEGQPAQWASLSMEPAEFLACCKQEELEGLVFHRIAYRTDWPDTVRTELAAAVRAAAARELARGAEICGVLDAMAARGIQPLVMKGAALAYSVYPFPAARPSNDTDLLVREQEVDEARRVMQDRGYRETPQCSELFSQFEVQKADRLGVAHVFDIHWNISAHPVFATALTYDELVERAVPVPLLGRHALAFGLVDALLLACIHPVMHHQNVERLLWLDDVHLLASKCSSADLDQFVDLARRKRMAAVSAHSLQRAQQVFRTRIPPSVYLKLAAVEACETSAEYLQPNRRWHQELASSVRVLTGWKERAALVRKVLFPSAHYMRGVYGVSDAPLGTLLLPALYVHRNLHGVWKILLGKK
jgi:Uncharacterised nucleotidyltransferase